MATKGKLPTIKKNPAIVKLPKTKVKAEKVKLPIATVKSAMTTSKTSAWQMDSFSVHCIAANYDPLSATGVALNVAIMDYEKECAQAEIDLIDRIKLIINPVVVPTSPGHR